MLLNNNIYKNKLFLNFTLFIVFYNGNKSNISEIVIYTSIMASLSCLLRISCLKYFDLRSSVKK
jgi:hypothetical protein